MKRRIALLTAFFMLAFSLTALANGFSDMPAKDSVYYNAFEHAIKTKLVSGVDGKLLPASPLSKAEAVTFISRVKDLGTVMCDLSTVTDITADKWYYNTMSRAVAAGIVTPDSEGKLHSETALTRRGAWDIMKAAFPASTLPALTDGEKTITRGDFILWLYNITAPTQPTESATKDEFSELRAKEAQEAMQVALGIRADGTSYITTTVYRDQAQTGWASGDSKGTSSRPSGGSSKPSVTPTEPTEPDEYETNAPTEAPTDTPTEEPTEEPTYAPTEPETQEPTYGEYDGPIDNDKDNVIEDPFGGGSGGSNDNDPEEDFDINDADEPDEIPSNKPTEEPTNAETEATDPSEEPTSDETEVTDPSEEPTSEETEATDPSEEPTSEETEVTDPSEEPTSEETEATDPSEEPTSEETEATDPSEEPTSEETEATEPKEEVTSPEETPEGDGNNDGAPDGADGDATVLYSKDWWFE